MSPSEVTQSLNLARALKLVASSRSVNGKLVIYSPTGQMKTWDSFVEEYPLERLQSMAQRARLRDVG